ncbi:MAG TPA: HIT family protein [Thermoanaerobaculia bacterium]|nr:HIT family protein [Thermoanaerobaculia bacterium]
MQCAFCEAENELSRFGTVIHEDRHCAVLLHPDSAVAGHAMLVWKRHVENVADLTPGELAHFASLHHAAEQALLQETGRERAILLKLGLQVPHLHLHIYPVAATSTRDEVMRAINGTTEERRPEGFGERCARALTALLS